MYWANFFLLLISIGTSQVTQTTLFRLNEWSSHCASILRRQQLLTYFQASLDHCQMLINALMICRPTKYEIKNASYYTTSMYISNKTVKGCNQHTFRVIKQLLLTDTCYLWNLSELRVNLLLLIKKNQCIDPNANQFRSMLINRHSIILIGIDQHWLTLGIDRESPGIFKGHQCTLVRVVIVKWIDRIAPEEMINCVKSLPINLLSKIYWNSSTPGAKTCKTTDIFCKWAYGPNVAL